MTSGRTIVEELAHVQAGPLLQETETRAAPSKDTVATLPLLSRAWAQPVPDRTCAPPGRSGLQVLDSPLCGYAGAPVRKPRESAIMNAPNPQDGLFFVLFDMKYVS